MTRNRLPSDFFIFGSPKLAEAGEPQDAFVFTAKREIDMGHLVEAMKAHMVEAPPPARLFLLGADPAATEILDASRADRLRDVLPEFTRYRDTPPVIPLTFNEKGGIQPLSDELSNAEKLTETITQEGLRWIFNKRGGMLRAGPGFHYLNPSGRHTTSFIRTGNVLLHSAEIAFVAMGLLRWWPRDLRRIFVDTASISSVAYALIELRRMFDDTLQPPSIDSFSSYAGLKEFEFVKTDSLCLISASTSGSLQSRIIKRNRLPSSRVVTIFYCGPPTDEDGVLCDLTERVDQDGIPPPVSYKRIEECEMCRRGSDVIGISGDQFLPADPEVTELALAAENAPDWLNEFLGSVLGQGIVRCHSGMAVDGVRPREIFFHLKDAIHLPDAVHLPDDDGSVKKRTPRFSDHLRRHLDTVVPASLNAIVHVDNASSTAMAKTVQGYCERVGEGDPPPVFTFGSLQDEEAELPPDASVLVVAGALSSGRTLLGISQFLRNVAKARTIVYLIGIARSTSAAEWGRLRSNLTWGRRKLDYPLSSVTFAHLPAELSDASSPWASEKQFLGEVREHIESIIDGDMTAVEEIEARRKQIDLAGSLKGDGLTSTVFLPCVQSNSLSFDNPKEMVLGPDFVFWADLPEDLTRPGTQAEVYLTLAAILHHLRDGGRSGSALVQHEHNRAVLAPANFGRFNDGVIQAAILRAARPRELDYSHKKDVSAQMRATLEWFIGRRDRPEGEAAPEFLLALAHERIHLMDTDTEALLDFLRGEELPPFMRALVQWMERDSDSEEQEVAAGVAVA